MADPKNPFVVPTVGSIVPLSTSAEPATFKMPTFGGAAQLGGSSAPLNDGKVIPAYMVPARDKRADLLWGASRAGKGINAWFAAYWVAKILKKKFLYLTAEPGSMPTQIATAINAGLGDMFSLIGQENLLSVLSTILEGGKWPVYLKKNDGSIVRDFTSREAQADPDQYGLIIVDAMTSIGDELIKWLSNPKNKATLPMTPGKEKFWIEDQGQPGMDPAIYGGSGMTAVGFATRILQQSVISSANLPYAKVLWIAREQRASRGEKKDKDGNILVAGEPMYGPDLPGTAATPRVTSWFGGAYHCDRVPVGGTKDDRKDVQGSVGNFVLPSAQGLTDRLTNIPDWEYRVYLRPHPDPRTGLMYDAGNRLPAHLNADSKVVPSYIVATEKRDGKGFIHTGLNTVYELERAHSVGVTDDLKEDLSDMLKKFNQEKS